MKRNYILFIIMLCLPIVLSGQNPENTCPDHFTDPRDNHSYNTVLIGDQCWMAENLNSGIMVPDFNQSSNGIIEKSCYNDNPELCQIYGGLYTWFELADNICPDGWHVPSKKEWAQLNEYLGIKETGTHLKSAPDDDPSWDGDNSSGFRAIPSGVGYENHFGRMGHWAVYWTSTSEDDDYAWFAQLDNHWYLDKYTILYLGNHFLKKNGFSVRCIKSDR